MTLTHPHPAQIQATRSQVKSTRLPMSRIGVGGGNTSKEKSHCDAQPREEMAPSNVESITLCGCLGHICRSARRHGRQHITVQ